MQSNKIKHGGILVAVSLLVADPAFALDFGNVRAALFFGHEPDVRLAGADARVVAPVEQGLAGDPVFRHRPGL